MLSLQRLFTLCCLVGGAFALCASAAEPARLFTVRGIVRAPFHDGTISIQHEEIPGFMPAMTMPFFVNESEVADLKPGDRVQFTFRVGERSLATGFKKLESSTAAPAAAPAVAAQAQAAPADGRPRLRAGDAVPAFSLRDQDERVVGEADLKGRHTILTFVFTRCPVPEFCPLIGQKFQALQQTLASGEHPPTWLLSISIDPEHDQPAVLRAYGASLDADFSRWRFATGARDEVEKLTRAFAVHTERNQATLDHTLATALVGPDGRVVEIWRGNRWTPEAILAKLPALPPSQ